LSGNDKIRNSRSSNIVGYPSYRDFQPASQTSSLIKKKNRSKDTKHEELLRSRLHRLGLRFRKNASGMTGKPDIIFQRSKVIVFCDGDFWHGRDWRKLKKKLSRGSNPDYWTKKIAANMRRDSNVNRILTSRGWHVIRAWETDILKDVDLVAGLIKDVVKSREP
jgi:DNA mismatch endonuclease (patch repair protein)